MVKNKTVVVYGLRDPRDGRIRYVGKSVELRERFARHLAEARAGLPTHKCAWLRQLLAEGVEPEVVALETVDGDWQAAERRWIEYGRAHGWDLTNATDGGEGTVGYTFSVTHRKHLSEAKKGKPQTTPPWMKGKKHSAESLAKMSASQKARFALKRMKRMVEDWT